MNSVELLFYADSVDLINANTNVFAKFEVQAEFAAEVFEVNKTVKMDTFKTFSIVKI